jgi:hypothetical protein
MEKLIVKPHHFLDIIKLYGSGLECFVPAPDFGHDFYRVGNIILNNPDAIIRLTIKGDDICIPCKYFDGERCVGESKNNTQYPKKENWNKLIDSRLFKKLGLTEGEKIKSLDLVILAKNKIKEKDILEIWKEKIIPQRAPFLLKGINKYIEKYKN